MVLLDTHHHIRGPLLHTQATDIINRQEIATEYQYLQNIIAELRDQADNRKIFGACFIARC